MSQFYTYYKPKLSSARDNILLLRDFGYLKNQTTGARRLYTDYTQTISY